MPVTASESLTSVGVYADEFGPLAAAGLVATDAVEPGRLVVVADAPVRRPPAPGADVVDGHDFLLGFLGSLIEPCT